MNAKADDQEVCTAATHPCPSGHRAASIATDRLRGLIASGHRDNTTHFDVDHQRFSTLRMTMLIARLLARASNNDTADILRIFMDAPSYTQLVEGRPPSATDVDDFFDGMPEGKDARDKFALGFSIGAEMIGCADVIRSYPTRDCAFIGLLLFSEAHQGRGHGKRALHLIEDIAIHWRCSKIRLAVISTNPRALAFWKRESFDILQRKDNPRFTGQVIVMERRCDTATSD